MPTIQGTVSPTGGVIVLDIELSAGLDYNLTPIVLERQTGSLTSSATVLYSGINTPIYVDIGDELPNYLDYNTNYYYTITDPLGSATTPAIQPQSTLQVFSNYLDKTLLRLFSAGFNSLAVPQGYHHIRVLEAMPLSMASEAVVFPFVVMNLDLEQQEFLAIGEGVNASETNINVLPLIVYRRYSLHILAQYYRERDFYKDAAISIFYNCLPVLQAIGNDVSLDLQAAQSQASEGEISPGFYESTLMLDITGQFNVSVNTNYPIIASIAPIINATTAISSGIPVVFP